MSVVERPLGLAALPLLRRGKVRDVYDLGDDLLIVASDRVSAFDVVLPTPIPGKGRILTALSAFWFRRTAGIVPNHFLSLDLPGSVGTDAPALAGRAMVVRRARRVDVECVVRGSLAGSAWREYAARGTIGGEPAPPGLERGTRFERPRFTPAWKQDDGHDESISREELRRRVGHGLARSLEEASLTLFDAAAGYAAERGLLLVDTKFEFGFVDDRLTLIDEALTPDSSRYWAAGSQEAGGDAIGYDKQALRDWLEQSGWDKAPPGPALPAAIVADTATRYGEVYRRLTGRAPAMVNEGNG